MFTSSRSTALPGRRSSLAQQGLPFARLKSLRKLALKLRYAGVATLNVHTQALYLHAEVAILADGFQQIALEGGVLLCQAQNGRHVAHFFFIVINKTSMLQILRVQNGRRVAHFGLEIGLRTPWLTHGTFTRKEPFLFNPILFTNFS